MRTEALLVESKKFLLYVRQILFVCPSAVLLFEMAVIRSEKSTTPDAERPPMPSDAEKRNASNEAAVEEKSAYVSGSRLALIISAILLAMFLVALVPSPASHCKAIH